MKKRGISLLLALCLVFSLLPTVVLADETPTKENPYADVKEENWFYEAVQYSRVNGFFSQDTKFNPNGVLTRGMFVTILGRMAGVDVTDYAGLTQFSDVSIYQYYAPYVNWAYRYGITDGTSDKTFSPEINITRQEMATLFVRYFDKFGVDIPKGTTSKPLPVDFDEIADWALESVMRLWRNGMLEGDESGFHPINKATRAQTATLCMRTDQTITIWYSAPGVRSTRVRINPDTMKPYNDDTGWHSTDYKVSFYDGETLLETKSVRRGQSTGSVPDTAVSNKENAVLVGYYLDKTFTQPFYADKTVTADLNVYARYLELDEVYSVEKDTRIYTEQTSSVSFAVKRVSGTVEAENAFTLTPLDGSKTVELSYADDAVKAKNGFEAGSTYSLSLAEGWQFTDEAASVRKIVFSIAATEKKNLRMNPAIKYIKDSNSIIFTVGGKGYENLADIPCVDDSSCFQYTGAERLTLKAGDLICLYDGKKPTERNTASSAELSQPAFYCIVELVEGQQIDFRPLKENEQSVLYDIPDNFPILVAGLPSAGSDTVSINNLDLTTYAKMVGTEEATLEKAKTKLSVGDFVTMYVTAKDSLSSDEVVYGEVTSVDEGTVIYRQTTRQSILDSMDLTVKTVVSGKVMLPESEMKTVKEAVREQLSGSEAENQLQSLASVKADTRMIPVGELRTEVEAVTDTGKLHKNNGLQISVTLNAQFESEPDVSGHKSAMDLTAVYTQEIALSSLVRGEMVAESVLGIIPNPTGISMKVNVDVLSFTDMELITNLYSVSEENSHLWEKAKAALSSTKKLSGSTTTVGEMMDQIANLQRKVDKKLGTATELSGYRKDIAAFWSMIADTGLMTEAEWKEIGEKLSVTSATTSLMEKADDVKAATTTETYNTAIRSLMQEYAKTLDAQTDWNELLGRELFACTYSVYGVCIGVDGTGKMISNLGLAADAELSYETGKRFSFWYECGSFTPVSGKAVTVLKEAQVSADLLAIGVMDLQTGLDAAVSAGIGTAREESTTVVSFLGLKAEISGFGSLKKSGSDGTLAVSGILSAKAGVGDGKENGQFTELLLAFGSDNGYTGFANTMAGTKISLTDEDGNAANGVKNVLTDSLREMTCFSMDTGLVGTEKPFWNRFSVTFSNPDFTFDPTTGCVTVNVAAGAESAASTVTVTFLGAKQAYRDKDLTYTFTLEWKA